MVNPDFNKVLKDNKSRYSFVVATAKRARQIADEAIDREEILVEKPVSLALDEMMSERIVIRDED